MTSHAHARERGIALILVVLFTLAMSAVGGSMMVLARTEAVSSANYRMMSQARYGAESGVHRAIHFLLNAYTKPGTGADPLANYNMAASPVTYLGQPVVLSSMAGVAANYPDNTVAAAFAATVTGTLPGGGTDTSYAASATLVSMRAVSSYGTTAQTVVQTWRITGSGWLNGVRNAQVEVTTLLEQQVVATNTYAAFATNNGCGALNFSGGVLTDSYDSGALVLVGGVPQTQAMTGDVGTNGNLTEGGGSVVNGTLSTPRTGVGRCSSGAVDALTANGNAQVTGGLIQLPQALNYPLPAAPVPTPGENAVNISAATACAGIGLAPPMCLGAGGNLTLTPGAGPLVLGNVRLSGGSTLHLRAGTYNLNSFVLTGNSNVIVDSGPIVFNIEGDDVATVVDLTGGTTTNLSFDPTNFQINYRGTGSILMNGGTAAAALVYAPRAALSLSGGANFYGSLLGASVTITGGTRVHYDRKLDRTFYSVGNQMLSAFNWKKF
jgi:Tfp pilus assembly protein PilX